jgi:hypothetical protein
MINNEDGNLYKELGENQYTRIPLKEQMKHKFQNQRFKNLQLMGDKYSYNDDDDTFYECLSSDEDENAAFNWTPLKIHSFNYPTVISNLHVFFIFTILGSKVKKSDIISTLVNIYGSQEQLLLEYENMLKERLLKNDYEAAHELETLILLKVRFGENNLHKCDIMLKDMASSSTINKAVHEVFTKQQAHKEKDEREEEILNEKDLTVKIISEQFWPIKTEHETLKFPEFLQKKFEKVNEEYSKLKQTRVLKFKKNLGVVTLTLTFENGSFQFKVSPIQAAIISLFNEKRIIFEFCFNSTRWFNFC